MQFSTLVRDARRRAGMTQHDLAQATGSSSRAVWLVEQGGGTLKTLAPILDLLRIAIVGLPSARNLGARVKAARLKKRLSLQKVSEKANLSVPTLRGLELGSGQVRSLEAAIRALAPRARQRQTKKSQRSATRHRVPPAVQSLVNGDCVTAMKSMDAASVHLVVTSPPYNAEKQYEEVVSIEDYTQFAEQWASCIPRILTASGALWLNVGYTKVSESETLPLTYLYYPLLKRHGLHLIQEVVWHYEGGMAYSRRFSHRTERWMWWVKDPAKYVFHLDDVRDSTLNRTGDGRNNAFGKNPTDYWHFDRVVGGRGAGREKTRHPCQFPEAMVERIVRACSNPGDVVLDCFGGSGTTAVVAGENGRGFISIEIDPMYHRIAEARLRGSRHSGSSSSKSSVGSHR